jgi:hypothetical protein
MMNSGTALILVMVSTPNGHLYRVTYTRYIDTINSPDDGHMAARNTQRIEINIGRLWNEVKGIAGDRNAWKLVMNALCFTSSEMTR